MNKNFKAEDTNANGIRLLWLLLWMQKVRVGIRKDLFT
jgi:hypothetical protein